MTTKSEKSKKLVHSLRKFKSPRKLGKRNESKVFTNEVFLEFILKMIRFYAG